MIIRGDCLEKLKDMPDNSVDAVVTDPPYGLKFMNKHWDYDVPKVELWREVLRVLKPGGHMLCACGTRTQHRMAVNIEDAGFEIRDTIAWLYGSGFPKSLDVSKAIDKAAGARREVIGFDASRARPNRIGCVMSEKPSDRSDNGATLTAPATDAAKEWAGWGTALKPALELWTLARKPLSESTVAKNVLRWGTGGINVDASRVAHASAADRASATPQGKVIRNNFAPGQDNRGNETNRPDTSQGRFPANLILDEEAGRALDAQSGTLKTGAMNSLSKESENRSMSGKNYARVCQAQASSGGASRFFYCAKSSKAERNAGLEGMAARVTNDGRQKDIDNAFQRGITERQNHHPTVKPLKLMEYLIRLITPPKGVVLDPFAGSGSTGVAAKRLNLRFIGIEREMEYCEIATRRMEAVMI